MEIIPPFGLSFEVKFLALYRSCDILFMPARRIGQRWEATRAPRQVTEVRGRAQLLYGLIHYSYFGS